MQLKSIVVILAFFTLVVADLYIHYPPGSNDRNQEANTDRNNANRLFDSQNNAQGGYCRGPTMSKPKKKTKKKLPERVKYVTTLPCFFFFSPK